jgi:hypothetical protein
MNIRFVDTRFNLDTLVEVTFERYRSNEICLSLSDAETGEDWATATSAFGVALPENCVAIKNWSENEGMAELLISNGIIEATPVNHIQRGFVSAPVHRLTAEAVAALAKAA